MQTSNHKMALSFSSEALIVVTVPETHADLVREAMGKAGAGKVGNYTFCSFSFKGVGRFLPGIGAHPAIGSVGKIEAVAEETIQTPCSVELLDSVIAAIKAVHPYEEPSIDLMPLYAYNSK